MVVAIILGAVSGVVGFVPLILGLRFSKHVTRTSNFGHASILLLAVFASIAVLAIAVVLCMLFAREYALPFTLAEAIALCVSAAAFGVYKLVRK